MTAPVLGPIGDLASHAVTYAELGWEIFPVNPGDKTPLVSQYKATTDTKTIAAWWRRWPTALIGHRIPADLIVLDIDPRHGGRDTWLALKDAIGELPVTRGHQSGRGDGGGHTWWRRPDDRLSIAKLTEWAREHQVGHPVLDGDGADTGRWSSGVDLLHNEHRYTILPPSPHPDTGRPYQWIDGRGPQTEPAPLPQLLVDLLTTDDTPAPPAPPRATDPDSIADWYTRTHTWTDILGRHGWRLVGGDGDSDRSRWRHPTATSAFSATVRHGCLFVYSPNTPFDVTEPGRPAGYTLFKAWATLEHHGDMSAAAAEARRIKGDTTPPDPLAHIPATTTSSAATTPAEAPRGPQERPEGLWLPQVVWDARPWLTHIHQAARARLVAPDAVLATILCRIAAAVPHNIDIPPTIGTPVGLTFLAALVGPPAAGKSAAAGLAAELLPVDPARVRDRIPIGSGEGFVEILFGMRPDPEDERRKIRTQTHHAAIFHIDEGAVLSDLGARSGSTLLPTLRTAFTHGTLGNANATLERRRLLAGHLYAYGVSMGIQPELAGPILADHAAGTPQRFLWLSATDPGASADAADWPGMLDWGPPSRAVLEAHEAPTTAGYRRFRLDLHPDIVAQVKEARVVAQRGESDDPGHADLLRLKVASLLALGDQTMDVDLEHWALAGIICDTSQRVVAHIDGVLAGMSARTAQAARERRAGDEVYVEAAKEQRRVAGAARSAAKGVHDCEAHAAGDGCPLRCMRDRLSSKAKRDLLIDDVIAYAVEAGWIRASGGRFHPGESRPA